MAKIIVFDQKYHIVRLFINVLRQRGHSVVGETDKSAFIRSVEESDFDLVLAGDPNDDNIFAMLRKLNKINQERESQRRSRFGVVALSHWSSDADVIRGWQCGVDGYCCAKPFRPLDVLATIDTALKAYSDHGDDLIEDPTDWPE